MKIIHISGSPYEIGFAHGSQGKQEVLCSISTYQAMFKTYANIDWTTAKQLARGYIAAIKKFDADLLEEIRGVADGAGVEVEDILALNVRSEIVLMNGCHQPSDGCTSIAITPEASTNHTTILAQNWDWKSTQIEAILVLKIKQNNKPDITMITEGGIIGKIGCNSAKIGVCLNALGTTFGNANGVPLHIILRGILNSTKLSDALQTINMLPNACAANYLIASACGEALDIEKAPTDFDVLYPQEGIIVHTNHFISGNIKAEDTTRLMVHDTFLRYGRANKLIRKEHGSISEETIKNIFSDHADYPDAICRHDDPLDPPGLRMCTVFSIVMNLTTGKIQALLGNPCTGKFEEIL